MADRRSFVVTLAALVGLDLFRVRGAGAILPADLRRHLSPGVTPEEFGAAGDGRTDDTAALQAAVDAAGTRNVPLTLGPKSYRTKATITSQRSIQIAGVPGATILKDHAGIGLLVAPAASFCGTTGIASATSLELVGELGDGIAVTGAWVEIGTPPQRRAVAASEGRTVTLTDPLDVVPPAGTTCLVYLPIAGVELSGFSVESPAHAARADRKDRPPRGEEGKRKGGLSNIRVAFADQVKVTDCGARLSGVDGLKVDMCRGVTVERGGYHANGSFGVLVYNSADVKLTDVEARDNTGDYNIEIKDCRVATASGCKTSGGRTGMALYASGLNPTHDCVIEGCEARGGSFPGFSAVSQTNEGTSFGGERWTIRHCAADGHASGFASNQAGAHPMSVTFEECTSTSSRNAGFNINAPGTQVLNCRSERSGGAGFRIQQGDCLLEGCTSTDDRFRARKPGAAVEILGSARRTKIRGLKVGRSTAEARLSRPVEESAGADETNIESLEIEDAVGTMARTSVLRGSKSRGPAH